MRTAGKREDIRRTLSNVTHLVFKYGFIFLTLWSEPSRAATYNGLISDRVTISKDGSPHYVTSDLIVVENAELVVEAGVELRFSPGVGLKVNGILTALGNPTQRIVFTKYNGGSAMDAPPAWPTTVRLANGSDIYEGVVQLKRNGQWRSICTNSANWTSLDAVVVCRQLGFKSSLNGYFTYNFTATDYDAYTAFPSPNCTGSEQDVRDCPGSNKMLYSSKICWEQRTLYLKCAGMRDDIKQDRWEGIKFYNSTFKRVREPGDFLNESSSALQYVDILYAGVTAEGLPTAAVSASPYVPLFDNVRVMFSAYDAFNFSEINSTTTLRRCEVAYNRGQGMNVTTSFGRVRVNDSSFHHNYGNGLYVRVVDKIYRKWEWRNGDFCNDAPASFPQLLTGTSPAGLPSCKRKFSTVLGHMLTVSLLQMRKDPTVFNATLSLYNGDCLQSDCETSRLAPLLKTWNLNTIPADTIGLPQSEVTTQKDLTIVFQLDKLYDQDKCKDRACAQFVLLISSAPGPAEDVALYGTSVSDNQLYGLMVENPRSYIKIFNGNMSANQYGAGFHIRGGACDLFMKDTVVDNNANSGINITYSGGRRIMQNVKMRNNNGIGLYIDFIRVFKTRIERHQKSELMGISIENNAGIGMRVGNYCGDSVIAINSTSSSSRIADNLAQGIELLSCYSNPTGLTNFTVAFTEFVRNGRMAILISPMLSMLGIIRNSTFSAHKKGVIRIDNTDDLPRQRAFQDKSVTYSIETNTFTSNSGPYVVYLRLTESNVQTLVFSYNKLVSNVVLLSVMGLKPRSHARAPLCVSSSNVFVNYNELYNPFSNLELATHSTDIQVKVDATKNWWGGDTPGATMIDVGALYGYHQRIQGRILDQDRRYNLASVKYYPALMSKIDLRRPQIIEGPPYYMQFVRYTNGTFFLGGILNDEITLNSSTYVVDSDIIVPDGRRLTIPPGAVLEFDNTVGAVVRGSVYAVGNEQQRIVLRRRLDSLSNYPNVTWLRLSGGDNELEGVLEMNITGEWATVCSKGWTVRDASTVCQQLGKTLQPDSWRRERPLGWDPNQPILMSQVQCDDDDVNITDCRHDSPDQFNDCTHDLDVAMSCVDATWAGVQFTTTAQLSELRYVTIQEAGLLDYFTNEYAPALQIDNNRHLLSDLLITRSTSTGLGISYSTPYGEDTRDISDVNSISRSTFSYNYGNGLLTKSTFLSLYQCEFINNGGAGFMYDPKLLHEDAFNLRKGVSGNQIINISQAIVTPLQLDRAGQVKYIQAKSGGFNESWTIVFEVKAAQINQRMTVQLLDYSPETNIEKLLIFDSDRSSMNQATVISIDEDNVDLPFVSSGDTLTFKYTINGVMSGRLMLSLSSRPQSDVPERLGVVPRSLRATLRLKDCTLSGNQRGLLFTHYNNPSNEYMDLFIRNRYEQVILENVTVEGNAEEAMFVPSVTKYNQIYMPTVELIERPHRMANITYIINNSRFIKNGKGIVAEHNHVDYSSNMWRWKFSNNLMQDNVMGGLDIELPLILNPYINGNHSIEVNNSRFLSNDQFTLIISGGFANLTLFRNTFEDNTARAGMISLTGTEKKMFIKENVIRRNKGKYMMEFNMGSHTEFGIYQEAVMERNEFRENAGLGNDLYSGFKNEIYSLTEYTLALRGVQKVNITRNIFADTLPYTFVAAVSSAVLTSHINVTLNYWGTTTQSVIWKKIFDYQDWNSYGSADYWPFLTTDSFDSPVAVEPQLNLTFDTNKPLGGVITADLTLGYREEPYRIIADLTVNPGVTLTVEPGVTFSIQPNIGILVLGRLIANGLPDKIIRFLPAENAFDLNPIYTPAAGRTKRAASPIYYPPLTQADGRCRTTGLPGTRLCGGQTANEGFIQMFNTTVHTWSLICDPEFNFRTAEVFCRSMGFYSGNVAVRYSELYEYFTFGNDRLLYKDLWTRTFLCKGDEDHIDECSLKINYNLEECRSRRGYVFIRCGDSNLDPKYKYWGNIRIGINTFEAGAMSSTQVLQFRSALRNVQIVGAGILHDNRVPAVTSTFQGLAVYQLDIRDCAYGGLEYIAPKSDVLVLNSRIQNNLGSAINIVVLNGQTNTLSGQIQSNLSTFMALNTSSVNYRTFGIIDMCDAEKVLPVDERVLVYYKYDFITRDCVKVFSSVDKARVSIRFLQVNLFHDNFSRNSIEVFDGPEFTEGFLLASIKPNSTDQVKRQLYTTTRYRDIRLGTFQLQYQLGIHIHASAASGIHGFIAEIVVGSSSYPGASGVHRVIGNYIHKNQGGSLRYSTVGETNPGLVVTGNYFQFNGLDILNLTAVENVNIEAQNVRTVALSVSNNKFDRNNGSVTIWLLASVAAEQGMRHNVSNNVFLMTINGEALRVYGNELTYLLILYNYFSQNSADYLNTVDIRDVLVNFTGNTMYANMGAHCLDLWSGDEIISLRQTVYRNQFYGNWAGDKFRESQLGGNNTLMYTKGINKDITQNWLENDGFSFELSTHNRSSSELPNDNKEKYVNARYNYWGYKIGVGNDYFTVGARSWGYEDDTNLSMIVYDPFHKDNISLLEGTYATGYCLVGWKLTENKKCYRYYGGISTYQEAVRICALENASVVQPKNQLWVDIGKVIMLSQQDYSDQIRAWVNEPEPTRPADRCSVIIDNRYDQASCDDLLPFVCEFEQIGIPPPPTLLYLWVILGVGGAVVLVAIVLVFFWCKKSRLRKEQRFERRASLRSSVRSNKYAISTGALTHASHSNLNTSVFGSMRTGLTATTAPMPRPRLNTRDTTLTATVGDVTVGETDIDKDENDTIASEKNGYTSTGYHGSIDSSRHSRDDLSQFSRPVLPNDIQQESYYDEVPGPETNWNNDTTAYENGAYYTDTEPSKPEPVTPKVNNMQVAPSDIRQRFYNQVRPGAGQPFTVSRPDGDRSYIPVNGRLPPVSRKYGSEGDILETNNGPQFSSAGNLIDTHSKDQFSSQGFLADNSRTAHMGSKDKILDPAKGQGLRQPPPSSIIPFKVPTGKHEPSQRSYGKQPDGYKNLPHLKGSMETLDTMDTKSVGSLDSDWSVNKPPPSYSTGKRSYYPQSDNPPFETDLDSDIEKVPLYNKKVPSRTETPTKQPLVTPGKGGYDSDAYYPRQAHDPKRHQEAYRHGNPKVETDIDATSDMTDHSKSMPPPNYRYGGAQPYSTKPVDQPEPSGHQEAYRYGNPKVETDIDARSDITDRSNNSSQPLVSDRYGGETYKLPGFGLPAVETDIDGRSDTSYGWVRNAPHETDF